MGLRYNPLNGSFDFTRSPGSYLDGEVATFADLPLDTAAAPLNSAWLVREGSGLWLLTRKPAGIYIRTATGGTDRNADYTYASAFPDVFSDANFTLYDDADSTKNAQFSLGSLTTGTTRTLTVPDASGTLPLLETANTFTQNQTLDGTNNVAPNQTAASGSSIMTRDLVDARAGQSIRLVLASDVSVANNTTLADVSGMSATLEAATYTFVGYVRFTASVSQVFKYRFNYTGTLSSALAHGMYYSDTSSAMLGALRGVNSTQTSNSRTLWVESYMGSMLLTTGGDFSFQFAQNASSADAVVIKAGSFLMLVKQ